MTYFTIREFFYGCTTNEILKVIGNKTYCDNLLSLGNALDRLRSMVNKPIIINSGFRDTDHNKRVGGVCNSQHLFMEAVDITIKDYPLTQIESILETYFRHEFGQVLIYDKRNFIHLALRNEKHRFLTIQHV